MNGSTYDYQNTAAGGIVGCIRYTGTVENCYNKADIYSESENRNNDKPQAGGICGTVREASQGSISITNCYNTGKVMSAGGCGERSAGTMIGELHSSNSVRIERCYSIGEIIADQGYRGGIYGRNYSSSSIINYSYCLEEQNTQSGEIKVNSETLKTYATDEYLGSAYLPDEYNINEGYPILEWELKAKKIIGKAYVNAEEGKIVVEIPFHKYNIVKVVNENGEELSKISNTVFKENMTSGNHVYTIIDNEGNEKKVNLNIRLVNSAESLNAFRDEVNNGNSFAGVTVYQTADIDMSSVCGEGNSWTPIGTGDTYFAGTYDGQYHTISNLYIKSNEYVDLGMFTQSTENTIIQNLLMENIYVENNSIEGLGIVRTSDGNTQYISTVGGIVGENKGIIKNCGIESGNIKFIKDNNKYQYIEACAGGIAGNIYETGYIMSCYNKADVFAEAPNTNYGQALAAGICGHSINASNNFNIKNCYNTGILTAKDASYRYTGGIVCRLQSSSNVNINNCYNIGELIDGTYATGGIAADVYQSSLSIKNSYCLNNATNGATLVDANTLKTYATDEYLGSAYIADEYDTNNGYPILKWEKEVR